MATTIVDDRTEAQRVSHPWLVIATDSSMSGWGGAKGGTSVAVWACASATDAHYVENWVESRSEMKRVRQGYGSYKPGRGVAHVHIYMADENHPALARKYEYERECAERREQYRREEAERECRALMYGIEGG